jgi:hypothetical protein
MTEQQELSIVSQETVLAAPNPVERQSQPADLRHFAMSLPVQEQQVILAEYKERRDHFRKWLLSQLTEGIHYGFAPGCEPRTKVINGVTHYGVWKKGKDGRDGEMAWYPPEQWTPRPPLYAAGADFICDLLGVRPEYEADIDSWKQLGYETKEKKAFVQKCKLYSKQTGEFLGEGGGARVVGQKGGDENNSLKMAMKAAKVSAVIETYSLRDLFSQDDGPSRPPDYNNPAHDTNAPRAAPRNERVTPAQVNELAELYKAYVNPEGNRKDFADYCRKVCNTTVAFEKLSAWESWQVAKVKETLEAAGR